MKRTFLVTCKQFALAAFCFASTIHLQAQTTTGGLKGFVKDPSATIELTNTATNEKFTITPQSNGSFSLYNLTPANTYTLKIVESGVENVQENLSIPLGDNLDLGLITASNSNLAEVKITGSSSNKNSAFSKGKQGASTVIGKSLLQEMPAGSRSLNDFIRFTPQSNGTSFAGASNRYNNLSIDGAANNDLFGLGNNSLPGSGAGTQPISLDAIQEMQIVLTPYNVTLGSFTGGGVNAVTRSGGNKEEGSVYGFMKHNSLTGNDPISSQATTAFSEYTYGARLGGAIIKDKLFYFVNYEGIDRLDPTLFNAGDPGSKISIADAQLIQKKVKDNYGYDVGTYDAQNLITKSQKALLKFDYVINPKHKISLRHNFVTASKDILQRSATAFQFSSQKYANQNSQNTTVLELKSTFSKNLFNNLIVSHSFIEDERIISDNLFPTITISSVSASLGTEPNSYRNKVNQRIIELTDNVKWVTGKHTFTFGTHNEYFEFKNSFLNRGTGVWTIPSINALDTLKTSSVPVTQYQGAYPAQDDANSTANLRAMQLGVYAQGETDITTQLNITYGLRLDIPVFLNTPNENPNFNKQYGYDLSKMPNGQLLWSPRIGFKYLVTEDKSVQLRGGVGIFSGRVPFVWITNNYSNDGHVIGSLNTTNSTDINGGNGLNTNVLEVSKNSQAAKSFSINAIDPNFKFPQLLRGNLAIDFKLPGGVELTIDGIYSKTLNNVLTQRLDFVLNADGSYNTTIANRNVAPPVPTTYGPNLINKPTVNNLVLNADGSINLQQTYGGGVYVLKNTNEGYAYSITTQVSKKFVLPNNLNLAINAAYTYGESKDVNSGISSVTASNFSGNAVSANKNFNTPPLDYSWYDLRHRVISGLTFKAKYATAFSTTVSLFYSGISGRAYSLTYNNFDLNGDGANNNDLVYIPTDLEIDGRTAWTLQERNALKAFINDFDELKNNRGNYTQRNAIKTPWEHVVDLRILQDIGVRVNGKTHALQLSFEIFNLGNFLNQDWGKQYSQNIVAQPFDNAGKVRLTNGVAWTAADTRSLDFNSRWTMQLGLRYNFN